MSKDKSTKSGLVVRGLDSIHEISTSNLITINVPKKKKRCPMICR